MARIARLPSGLDPPSHRVARFFEKYLTHGKGEWAGQPFRLNDWQLSETITPIYDTLTRARDGALLRVVREGLVGVAKKNGKTTESAGLGLYALFADGYYVPHGKGYRWQRELGAEVFNVAGSKDQAKVLFQTGVGMVRRDPYLSNLATIYRDAIEFPETGGVWRVLAADARLAHGPSPSTAIIDELWVHKDEELYEAFASAGAARRQPLLLTITTAGWDKDSIAHRLYQRGLTNRDRSFYFRWWQAPDGCDLDDREAWKAANPSPWVTQSYLEAELKRAKTLGLEAQFRRWHLNQWTSGSDVALPAHVFLKGSTRPHIPEGSEIVVGVDTAPKRDSTAVVIVRRDEAGTHHVKVTHMRADPDTGYLDYGALEDMLRELCRRYDVARILVDPYNMMRSLIMLADEGLPVEEVPQDDKRMVRASMFLYELHVEGRIRHGAPRELRAQAANTSKRVTERGWRFQKLKSAGVIDAIVAMAIACYYAEVGIEDDAEPLLVV